MAFQIQAKVVYNNRVSAEYFHCAFQASKIIRAAHPGQFVNIRVSNDLIPLLRRPFSIHRVSGSKVEILYEVLGQGTQILSQRKAGEYLDVIGPLGHGFDYGLGVTDCRLPILVAGGMGVAPLLFWQSNWSPSQGVRKSPENL